MIGISKIVLGPGSIVVVAVLVTAVVLFRRWIKTDEGRLKWDALQA